MIKTKMQVLPTVLFDRKLQQTDAEKIYALLKNTGVFNPVELKVAREMAEQSFPQSEDYQFIIARLPDDTVVGYTCFGEIALTKKRFDLYWIAVDPSFQKTGIGKLLFKETETEIMHQGGCHIYAETSGTTPYMTAQNFYKRMHMKEVARLKDFYRPEDDKIIFQKIINPD